MTNRQTMLKALNKNVIPKLFEQGFTGEHPHYRREKDDCIELISFDTNKWGGSFTIEVSAVFPSSKHTNCLDENIAENVWGTSDRYRLDGMFDGWFYYSDVYLVDKYLYEQISEKQAETFIPPKHYKLVQKFTPDVAENICSEINNQFIKAFVWLNNFEKNNSKKSYHFMRKIKLKIQSIIYEIKWVFKK